MQIVMNELFFAMYRLYALPTGVEEQERLIPREKKSLCALSINNHVSQVSIGCKNC